MSAGARSQGLLAGLTGPGSVGRYGLVGVSGVALDAVLYVALVAAGALPVVATVVSTATATVSNYLLQARFTFVTRPTAASAVRYLSVGAVGVLLAGASLQVLLAVGLGPFWAKALSVPAVVVAQYVVNKRWSFA